MFLDLELKNLKEYLTNLGGKPNYRLGARPPNFPGGFGYIFPATRRQQVEQFVQQVNSGALMFLLP